MRRTTNGSKTFSLSESVSKIDWDVFQRVIGENLSHAAAVAETSGSAVSGAAVTYKPAAGAFNQASQIQCWGCFEYGHTKPNCPSMVKPTKGQGKGQFKAPPPAAAHVATYPAITNGGLGDGGKGAGKDGKVGKGKKGQQLANNVAAVFARPR
jgi:hypothetical protein